MKLIIFGATGFVGTELLRQSLLRKDITSVVAVSRRALPASSSSPKLTSVIVKDYDEYSPEDKRAFEGANGCIWSVSPCPISIYISMSHPHFPHPSRIHVASIYSRSQSYMPVISYTHLCHGSPYSTSVPCLHLPSTLHLPSNSPNRTIAITPSKSTLYPFPEVVRVCQTHTLLTLRTLLASNPGTPFRYVYMSGSAAERDQTATPSFKPEYCLMRVRSSP